MANEIKKVVLAYSGGLDTSIIIPWLKENYNNCEVIAVSGDVGQGTELDGLEEKAKKTGASKLYVLDLKEEFIQDYVYPTVKAGAVYENKYLLGTSFARPIIAKGIVDIAKKEGADAICHGCTGKGNDQVRFELAIKAFAPDMKIIAPWRIWNIKSREEEIEYAEAHNVPLKINRETNYSKDKNLWHLSHEGLDLENPGNEPQYNKPGFLELGVSPEQAPDEPTYITLHFEKGVPTTLNGETLTGVEMVTKLNELGGKNGIGLADIIENRLVGMKSRGVYETPGGTILYHAHNKLEELCLDKETYHYKQQVALKFADLVYNGQWYTPLRQALSAFVDSTQETVTGDVKLKLYKGNIIDAGVTSPYSLYDEEIATFDEDEVYNQADSAGFINLFGLPIKVQAKKGLTYDKYKTVPGRRGLSQGKSPLRLFSRKKAPIELVDIYDAQGNPTGMVRARGEPLKDGEYLLAVGVWIVDEENNILLTQRSLEKRWAPGKWENTAGHVQAGEDCPAAMVRELWEEIGLKVSKEELIPLGTARTGKYFGENYGLRLRKHPDHLILQPGETCAAKWVTPEELDAMAKSGELSPSVLSHLEGGYRTAFLKLIGRENSTLLGKDEVP